MSRPSFIYSALRNCLFWSYQTLPRQSPVKVTRSAGVDSPPRTTVSACLVVSTFIKRRLVTSNNRDCCINPMVPKRQRKSGAWQGQALVVAGCHVLSRVTLQRDLIDLAILVGMASHTCAACRLTILHADCA